MQGSNNTFMIVSIVVVIQFFFIIPAVQSLDRSIGAIESVGFKVGTDSETAVSGTSGIKHQASMTKVTSNRDAVRGLEWLESGDLPCRLQTLVRDLNDGTDTATGWYWERCPGGFWGNKKVVSFDDNPRYYVRGLAVCDSKNKGNDRIKGIKIYPAKVWKTKEQVDAIGTPVTATHSNCGAWKPAVFCPSGAVAHGFIFHTELDTSVMGGSGNSAIGIALKCAEVNWNRAAGGFGNTLQQTQGTKPKRMK